MSSATYKTAEARANFSALLARAKAGEEISITKGGEPQARLVPPSGPAHREIAPLAHLNLPGDLYRRGGKPRPGLFRRPGPAIGKSRRGWDFPNPRGTSRTTCPAIC